MTIRLTRLEEEITAIRQAIETMPESDKMAFVPVTDNISDKDRLVEQMQQLLNQFSVTGSVIGVEKLQSQMRQSGLHNNELSQSLIATRENN